MPFVKLIVIGKCDRCREQIECKYCTIPVLKYNGREELLCKNCIQAINEQRALAALPQLYWFPDMFTPSEIYVRPEVPETISLKVHVLAEKP